jgi:primosomal protein N' (replication factor Y) (superfamily II helicase)
VVGVRQGDEAGLKPLQAAVDPHPLLDAGGLQLVGWIAGESLSSPGATALALLPPPGPMGRPRPAATPRDARATPPPPAVLSGPGREGRLLEQLAGSSRPALVLTADIEGAARWGARLAKLGDVVRLDSGVADTARAAGWAALAAGEARLAVGTRSALLAPLPPGSTIALIDEQEVGHRPPGPPRIHSREVVLARAAREGLRACLTAPVPSVEMWAQERAGQVTLDRVAGGPRPAIDVLDARGMARREPLAPAAARLVREALAGGRRVFLCVSRLTSALGCEECATIARCDACGIALAYSPGSRALVCRLCGVGRPTADVCPGCHGRRWSPIGWGAERVEQALRRRFPGARIARYDPESARGKRGEAARAAALAAEVVVGTRSALRLFGPRSLGLAVFVSPDQLLGLPDFRAAERTFTALWAATERVRPDGAVIVQSRNREHYAVEAFVRHDLGAFYGPELAFRAELGYPPFRRLAVVTARARDIAGAERLAESVHAALRGSALTVYPPAAARGGLAWRVIVKGPGDLPALLAAGLAPWRESGPRRRGIIDVEVDPVEWQS